MKNKLSALFTLPFIWQESALGFHGQSKNQEDLLTRKGNPILLPTFALAKKFEAEMQSLSKSQPQKTSPNIQLSKTCPISTRIFNVIDHIIPSTETSEKLTDKIIAYSLNDLLCYRANSPESLQALETKNWQFWLDWAQKKYNIQLQTTTTIIQISQNPTVAETMRNQIITMNVFARAGFLELTEILGSAILALALRDDCTKQETIFDASMLHEDFQAQKWGETDEYKNFRYEKSQAFFEIHTFYQLCEN